MGGNFVAFLLAVCLAQTHGFLSQDAIGDKNPYLTDAILRDVMERMGKQLSEPSGYVDYPGAERRLAMMARAGKDLESEQIDYDSLVEGNPHPSLRDQEFLQHSSLWGHQYVAGGAGEGEQRLHPSGVIPNRHLVKTDAVLPAYCNPPNPCPVGYTEEQGCLAEFENTAAFSREYQASQRCMCDGEHMFSCPPNARPDPALLHFRPNAKEGDFRIEEENPYLAGDRLPIAAKKGFDVNFYDEK